MAYEFNGTNQSITATSSPVGADEPITMAAWVNLSTDANSGRIVVCCNNTNTSGAYYGIQRYGTLANDPVTAEKYNSVTTASASMNSSSFIGSWNHVVAVFSSNTLRTVYVNGSSTSNTTSLGDAATTFNRLGIAVLPRNTAISYIDGKIAEVGIWNQELTRDEIQSLYKGMRSTRIRPQGLVFYAPLVRTIHDTRQRLNLTNNGSATVANHPRVY